MLEKIGSCRISPINFLLHLMQSRVARRAQKFTILSCLMTVVDGESVLLIGRGSANCAYSALISEHTFILFHRESIFSFQVTLEILKFIFIRILFPFSLRRSKR